MVARTAVLVEALALDDDPCRRTLEGLHVRGRDADVLEPRRLQRLEAEDVADQARRHVGDRALLEQDDVVRDVGEVLGFLAGAGAGARHGVDAVGLGLVRLVRRQQVGPDHRPGGGRRLARHGGRRFVRIDAFLRCDPEHADHVRVLRLVVRPPVAHLLVLQDATLVALLGVPEHSLDRFVHRLISL
jgi:hypothetical protein